MCSEALLEPICSTIQFEPIAIFFSHERFAPLDTCLLDINLPFLLISHPWRKDVLMAGGHS